MRRQALSVLVVLVLALAGPAPATVFPVTKTADTADGVCNADCSLREAVIAANAAPGDDEITLPAGYRRGLSSRRARKQLPEAVRADLLARVEPLLADVKAFTRQVACPEGSPSAVPAR